MKQTVLNYLATDKFALLVLSADYHAIISRQRRAFTVSKSRFDPVVLESFGTYCGTPSIITCIAPHVCLDEEGNFHATDDDSFSCYDMKLIWLDEDGNLHRNIGPAIIHMKGLRLFHNHGVLNRFQAAEASFDWFRHNQAVRENGPVQVSCSDITGTTGPEGFGVDSIRMPEPTALWTHPGDGKDIEPEQIVNCIRKNNININLFHPDDGVFPNPMEEMIFYGGIS